jgi:4-alpha-glucanotransferase
VWTGSDLAARQARELAVNDEAEARVRDRLVTLTGADDDAPVADVVEGVYGRLAGSPSVLVGVTIDDLLCVEERPNLPGTTDEWPNWRVALPASIDALDEQPTAVAVATVVTQGRVAPPRPVVD